jgi:hypothetical protein
LRVASSGAALFLCLKGILMRRYAVIPVLLMLSACEGSVVSKPVEGTSPGEDAALNDAAEMLDQSEADGNTAAPAQ